MPNDDNGLFGTADEMAAWAAEWQDMPEFVQEDQKAWKDIIVHFNSLKDLEAFAKAIGQKLTVDTKYIWYPAVKDLDLINRRCADES